MQVASRRSIEGYSGSGGRRESSAGRREGSAGRRDSALRTPSSVAISIHPSVSVPSQLSRQHTCLKEEPFGGDPRLIPAPPTPSPAPVKTGIRRIPRQPTQPLVSVAVPTPPPKKRPQRAGSAHQHKHSDQGVRAQPSAQFAGDEDTLALPGDSWEGSSGVAARIEKSKLDCPCTCANCVGSNVSAAYATATSLLRFEWLCARRPSFEDHINVFMSSRAFPRRLLFDEDACGFLDRKSPATVGGRPVYVTAEINGWFETQRLPFFSVSDELALYMAADCIASIAEAVVAAAYHRHDRKVGEELRIDPHCAESVEENADTSLVKDGTLVSGPLLVKGALAITNTRDGAMRFRRFLQGKMGERDLNFWMEAEKYRQTPDSLNDFDTRRRQFRSNLLNYYLADDGPMALAPGSRDRAVCRACEIGIDLMLLEIQSIAARNLALYWLPQFAASPFVDRKTERTAPTGVVPATDATASKTTTTTTTGAEATKGGKEAAGAAEAKDKARPQLVKRSKASEMRNARPQSARRQGAQAAGAAAVASSSGGNDDGEAPGRHGARVRSARGNRKIAGAALAIAAHDPFVRVGGAEWERVGSAVGIRGRGPTECLAGGCMEEEMFARIEWDDLCMSILALIDEAEQKQCARILDALRNDSAAGKPFAAYLAAGGHLQQDGTVSGGSSASLRSGRSSAAGLDSRGGAFYTGRRPPPRNVALHCIGFWLDVLLYLARVEQMSVAEVQDQTKSLFNRYLAEGSCLSVEYSGPRGADGLRMLFAMPPMARFNVALSHCLYILGEAYQRYRVSDHAAWESAVKRHTKLTEERMVAMGMSVEDPNNRKPYQPTFQRKSLAQWDTITAITPGVTLLKGTGKLSSFQRSMMFNEALASARAEHGGRGVKPSDAFGRLRLFHALRVQEDIDRERFRQKKRMKELAEMIQPSTGRRSSFFSPSSGTKRERKSRRGTLSELGKLMRDPLKAMMSGRSTPKPLSRSGSVVDDILGQTPDMQDEMVPTLLKTILDDPREVVRFRAHLEAVGDTQTSDELGLWFELERMRRGLLKEKVKEEDEDDEDTSDKEENADVKFDAGLQDLARDIYKTYLTKDAPRLVDLRTVDNKLALEIASLKDGCPSPALLGALQGAAFVRLTQKYAAFVSSGEYMVRAAEESVRDIVDDMQLQETIRGRVRVAMRRRSFALLQLQQSQSQTPMPDIGPATAPPTIGGSPFDGLITMDTPSAPGSAASGQLTEAERAAAAASGGVRPPSTSSIGAAPTSTTPLLRKPSGILAATTAAAQAAVSTGPSSVAPLTGFQAVEFDIFSEALLEDKEGEELAEKGQATDGVHHFGLGELPPLTETLGEVDANDAEVAMTNAARDLDNGAVAASSGAPPGLPPPPAMGMPGVAASSTPAHGAELTPALTGQPAVLSALGEADRKIRNKVLWREAAVDIISLRRCIMNSVTYEKMRAFLRHKGGNLENDLLFWIEVERCKAMGSSEDDSAMAQIKINTIIDCFLDSAVPPACQVDVNEGTRQFVLKRRRQSLHPGVLFREIQLVIFYVLMKHWSDFCRAIVKQQNRIEKENADIEEDRMGENAKLAKLKRMKENGGKDPEEGYYMHVTLASPDPVKLASLVGAMMSNREQSPPIAEKRKKLVRAQYKRGNFASYEDDGLEDEFSDEEGSPTGSPVTATVLPALQRRASTVIGGAEVAPNTIRYSAASSGDDSGSRPASSADPTLPPMGRPRRSSSSADLESRLMRRGSLFKATEDAVQSTQRRLSFVGRPSALKLAGSPPAASAGSTTAPPTPGGQAPVLPAAKMLRRGSRMSTGSMAASGADAGAAAAAVVGSGPGGKLPSVG